MPMTLPVKTPRLPNKDNGTIRRKVLAVVEESKCRITPGELKKRLLGSNVEGAEAINAAIRDLISSRELKYTYQLGCSFIEKSFEKPTRVSRRVILKPPGTVYDSEFSDIVVDILKGASFGFGDHPTTRLAIQGIESALSENHGILETENSRGLDIGTGSGVLAIVAVMFGIINAVGIDIDPCARAEAQNNVQINGLEHRIKILGTRIEDINETYSLITANLRYPTLKQFCPHIAGITRQKGSVVMSGIKSEEVEGLINDFSKFDFTCIWKTFEKDWVGIVLSR